MMSHSTTKQAFEPAILSPTVPVISGAQPLTASDLQQLKARYIEPEHAQQARLCRVDHNTGAETVGRNPHKAQARYEGILIPYLGHDDRPVEFRLRRDTPDYRIDEKGETHEEGKYLGPPQRSPRIYSPPLSGPHGDADEVWFVEGEFKGIALSRLFHESGRRARVIALAGVDAWSGSVGKVDHPTVQKKIWVKGLIPGLASINWDGKSVVILFDANVHTSWRVRTARKKLAGHLAARGANVRFVEIPADVEGVNGIDDLLALKGPEFVTTLFEQQLRAAELQKLEFYAAEQQDFAPLAEKVWEALAESEEIVGRSLFWSGGIMTRLQPQGDRAQIEELTVDRLSYRLTIMAKWYRERLRKDVKEKYRAAPPTRLIRHMLAAPQPETPLPVLKQVVTAPVFTADGDLLTQPGYHEGSGVYYLETFKTLPPPAHITKADCDAALRFLRAELLVDFPFAAAADEANALALMLLPFVREMIAGPTPLHLLEASLAGSGKGLLIQVLLSPALGEGGIGTAPQPEDDAEWAKLITSNLTTGKGALWIDNLSRPLDSGVFANALTAPVWEGRILGVNRTACSPVRLVWVATGNNPTLSSEITRRTVRTRLTPNTDKPEERDDFKHAVLTEWMAEHRAEIVRAIHTIVLYWIAQGRPNGQATLGSYERWARVMGGILECAGVAGFMGNYREFRERADVQRTARAAFCDEWWRQRVEKEYRAAEERGELLPARVRQATARDLRDIAQDIEGLPINGNIDTGFVKSLGQYLAASADVCPEHVEKNEEGKVLYTRRFRISQAGTRKRAALWEIELLEEI